MNSEDLNVKSMEDVLTEQESIEFLGIERSGLDRLRYEEKLPFCKITNRKRMYLVKDLLDFIVKKRTTLNRGSDEKRQDT